MRYDRGAITLETKGVRAKPYRAAPRRVAVSASAGLAITRILVLNCACGKRHDSDVRFISINANAHLNTLLQILAASKTSDQHESINSLMYLGQLFFDKVDNLVYNRVETVHAISAQ